MHTGISAAGGTLTCTHPALTSACRPQSLMAADHLDEFLPINTAFWQKE